MDIAEHMDIDMNIPVNIIINIEYLTLTTENAIRNVKNIINRIEFELIAIIPELSVISINDYITSNITERVINITNMIYMSNNIENNVKQLIDTYRNMHEIRQILSGYLRIMKIKQIIPETPEKILKYIEYINIYYNFK